MLHPVSGFRRNNTVIMIPVGAEIQPWGHTIRKVSTPQSDPSDRTNKKAEVITLMKRAKGATLAEIMAATGWQRHTVRGFVSILGSKGGEKIDSSKNAAGERTYKIGK